MKNSAFLKIAALAILLFFGLRAEGALAALRINEIMYDLAGPDKTEFGTGREWVEIFNNGEAPVTLVGGNGPGSWRFVDSYGPHLLAKAPALGTMTIAPKDYAILAADAPTFLKEHPNFQGTVIDTVMNLKNTQDIIKLRDGEGTIVSEAYWASNLGAAGNGRTLEFANGVWREGLREGGSPGLENSIENVPLPEAPTPLPPTSLITPFVSPSPVTSSPVQLLLVISEFLPNPVGPDNGNEWIELKNESAKEISLENWSLGTESSGREWQLNGNLPAGGFLVIPSSKSRLSLRNSGDRLYLKNPSGKITFEVAYQNEIPEGWAGARFAAGWKLTKKPTPGQANRLVEDSLAAARFVEDTAPKEESPAQSALSGEGPEKRLGWILALGLVLGIAAAFFSLFLKRKMFV